MNVHQFYGLPIQKQLSLEEHLLRHDTQDHLIINRGSPKTIVLGLSNKKEEMVHLDKTADIPIIQRFSGGGTVIVDETTLFITFIKQEASHPDAILHQVFSHFSAVLPDLQLQAQDFTLNNKKVAGSAQYIRKQRWLHHTSFLTHVNPAHMAYLRHPPKEPAYRAGRSHLDFLTPLPLDKEDFIRRLLAACVGALSPQR